MPSAGAVHHITTGREHLHKIRAELVRLGQDQHFITTDHRLGMRGRPDPERILSAHMIGSVTSSLGGSVAERAARDEFEYSVETLPPTPRHRRLAFAVVVLTLAAYGAVAPFAKIPLPRIDGFIPTILAIVFVTDLVTAVLLFAQFSATGSHGLLVLASGYLFSSLCTILFALTFPGAYAPTGLLGAGPQSAAWLNVSFRFGFGLATVGYALLISGKHTKGSNEPSPRPAIFPSVAIVVIVVCALTSAVTAGHDFVPRLVADGTVLPLGNYLNGMPH